MGWMIRLESILSGQLSSISGQAEDENPNLIAFRPPKIYDWDVIMSDVKRRISIMDWWIGWKTVMHLILWWPPTAPMEWWTTSGRFVPAPSELFTQVLQEGKTIRSTGWRAILPASDSSVEKAN